MPPTALRARLQADLTVAMKARDTVTVAVVRTALAALANAEAQDADALPAPVADGPLLEYPRLVLTPADEQRIFRHEVADRRDTEARYTAAGRDDAAAEMQAEI